MLGSSCELPWHQQSVAVHDEAPDLFALGIVNFRKPRSVANTLQERRFTSIRPADNKDSEMTNAIKIPFDCFRIQNNCLFEVVYHHVSDINHFQSSRKFSYYLLFLLNNGATILRKNPGTNLAVIMADCRRSVQKYRLWNGWGHTMIFLESARKDIIVSEDGKGGSSYYMTSSKHGKKDF